MDGGFTMEQSCAFTGHRPKRFSFGYDEKDEQCIRIKEILREYIFMLADVGVHTFYTGMALGADQWAAEIVLELKKERAGIRLTAVRPCETQADGWSEEQRERYFDILARCDEEIIISKTYTNSCMFERDRRMVDSAAYLLAVYDGGSKGGTAYTVNYARKNKHGVICIHPDTLAVEANINLDALRARAEIKRGSGME